MTRPVLLAKALIASVVLAACDGSAGFNYETADDAAKTEYLRGKALTFIRTEAISGFNMLAGNPMAQTFGPELPKTEILRFNANFRTRTIHITMEVGRLHIDQSFANISSGVGRGSVNRAKRRQEKQQRACAEYSQSVFAELDLKLTIRTMNGTRVAPGQISLNRGTCRRQMQSTT